MTRCIHRNFSFNGSLHVSENYRNAAIDPDLPPAVPKKGRGQKETQRYTCLGFLLIAGTRVDVQEYLDFRHVTWYLVDLKSDLKFEALPSGLLIRCPTGEARVVLDSQLYPLNDKLEVVKEAES